MVKNSKMIKSPLRYPGGKSRAVERILSLFPTGITSILSPFMGGGSVEINLANQGIEVYAFDKFIPLSYFWTRLNYQPDIFAEHIQEFFPLTKEGFYREQKRYINLLNNGACFFEVALELAAVFYVLNRSSFDGTTISGGCSSPSARFTQSSIDRVKNWKPLKNLSVNIADFQKSIPARKDDFIFADPPYMIKSKLYGNKGSHHKNFDHQALFDLLSKRDGWILCYNDCPTIREMYGKFNIIEPEWSYGMGKNKKSRELLILNY